MDLQASLRDFVARAKQLGLELDSVEATTLTRADLHILEVQLYLLQKSVQRRQYANRISSAVDAKREPNFPPFFSDRDDEGEHSPP